MTTKIRLPFFDCFLLKMNTYFACVLYIGLLWLLKNHPCTADGCSDYDMKFRRFVVWGSVTFCCLMGTVLIGFCTIFVWLLEFDSPALKNPKYRMGEVFVMRLSGFSYIGLMFAGYFFSDYLIAGMSSGAV